MRSRFVWCGSTIGYTLHPVEYKSCAKISEGTENGEFVLKRTRCPSDISDSNAHNDAKVNGAKLDGPKRYETPSIIQEST